MNLPAVNNIVFDFKWMKEKVFVSVVFYNKCYNTLKYSDNGKYKSTIFI